MKKYVLSTIVIGAFLAYSFVARRKQDVSQVVAFAGTSNTANTTTTTTSGSYKDGTYTGNVADAFYGNIQVAAVINNGKLTAVNILQYPNDRSRSVRINSQALPILQSEAIQVQSGTVDMVSGATDTSQAFITSLTSALQQAKI